ncbi:MAG: formylglycine-generating enzyme family protein [Hyphomicrobiaceae bacterium]
MIDITILEFLSGVMFATTGALLFFALYGRMTTAKRIAAGLSLVTVALGGLFMMKTYSGERELDLQRAGPIKRRLNAGDRGHFQYEDADSESAAAGSKATTLASAANRMLTELNQRMFESSEGNRPCGVCPDVVVIEPGYFHFGAAPDDEDANENERPRKLIRLSKPYAIGRTEVTVRQYMAFVAATGHPEPNCANRPNADDMPITCVSPNDALSYVRWLRTQSNNAWRLPTEPEWEWAAGASTQPVSQTGGKLLPVRFAPENELGVVGVSGNVAEIAGGCWHEKPSGYRGDGLPGPRGDCSKHPLRDAAWFEHSRWARSTARRSLGGDERRPGVGFRVMYDF